MLDNKGGYKYIYLIVHVQNYELNAIGTNTLNRIKEFLYNILYMNILIYSVTNNSVGKDLYQLHNQIIRELRIYHKDATPIN